MGSYRGPHIEVTNCTEPGPEDLATLSSFARVDDCHQRAATNAWLHSNQTATYVGEWHSHPFGQPNPSGIDRNTWRTVVARLKMPCLFVIVSPAGWRVFRILGSKPKADAARLKKSDVGTVGLVFR